MIGSSLRRTDRLFQIIQILRRSSRPVTARALADELEVSARTIYRGIADLIGQRVPITGEAGVGYVLGPGYDMPPLALTPGELEAVVLGAQWVVVHGDRTLSRAAQDVLAKVAAIVPEQARSFVDMPATAVKPRLEPVEGIAGLPILREAIRKEIKLCLLYRDLRGNMTERIVWPIVLGYSENACMLIAWCELRQGFRHFCTDRIDTVEVQGEQIGERRYRLLRRWEAHRIATLAANTPADS